MCARPAAYNRLIVGLQTCLLSWAAFVLQSIGYDRADPPGRLTYSSFFPTTRDHNHITRGSVPFPTTLYHFHLRGLSELPAHVGLLRAYNAHRPPSEAFCLFRFYALQTQPTELQPISRLAANTSSPLINRHHNWSPDLDGFYTGTALHKQAIASTKIKKWKISKGTRKMKTQLRLNPLSTSAPHASKREVYTQIQETK